MEIRVFMPSSFYFEYRDLDVTKLIPSFLGKRFQQVVRVAKATVVTGTHYKEILRYVADESIDLIIMGSGSPLQKAVFGSVADKVTKLSPVPVMLIKSN